MELPAPYSEASDEALVQGCVDGDEDAWAALDRQHGRLMRTVAVRVLDELGAPRRAGVAPAMEAVAARLRRNHAGPLRTWDPSCSLRHYLAVLARGAALEHAQPPPAAPEGPTTPAGILLGDLVAIGPALEITDALDKFSPNISAMVRLELHGVGGDGIAAALGLPPQTVGAHLARVATRLGQREGPHAAQAALAWRILLGCAPIEERVATAIRAEDDAAFASVRKLAEDTWEEIRARVLARRGEPDAECLDDRGVAAFVGGGTRGPERARAEGHLTTCARCVDSVAALTLDIEARQTLRLTHALSAEVAVAAALVATGRCSAAEELVEPEAQRGARCAREILRLARVGVGLAREQRRTEMSGVVTAALLAPDEAPLAALEALLARDLRGAALAIDDRAAKTALGDRLRLLADAAGHDVEAARRRAFEIIEGRRAEPGLVVDAGAIAALPTGRALPEEILDARLRDALPQAVRFFVTR